MATKAIVGEKIGMTQVWGEDNRIIPVTVLKVAPLRIVQVKTAERDGYTAVQVTYGHKDPRKLNKPEAGHFAKAGVEPGVAPASSCASTRSTASRSARRSRSTRLATGDTGRRHRHQPGQGLRRRHEAPQLLGPGRQPRQPQAPPGPGLHRRRVLPGPGVQGHEDGRPDGRRAGHHAQPRGRPGRRRARPPAGEGLRTRAPRRRRDRARRRQGRQEGGLPDGQRHREDAPPAPTRARSTWPTTCSASSPTCP